MNLSTLGDPREVVTDTEAGYFGTPLEEDTFVPGGDATVFETHFDDWLARNGK